VWLAVVRQGRGGAGRAGPGGQNCREGFDRARFENDEIDDVMDDATGKTDGTGYCVRDRAPQSSDSSTASGLA